MTGAYAQRWPGQGPWSGQWGRERGPQDRGGRHGGCHAGGRHGGPGRPSDLEALAGWLLSRAGGRGGPGGEGRRRPSPEELEELIALRRMGGAMFGGRGGPRGPRGRGRGRARRGDVRLAVLRLLAEEPRNGYQLIQTIEERSGGAWRPSPGSMYPTLSQLEDEGLIRSAQTEGSRGFEITDAGREQLADRAGEPDPWSAGEGAGESPMAELGPLVIGIGKAVWQVASVGDEQQRRRALGLLDETRRGLYRILAEETDEPAGEDDVEDDPDAPGEPDASAG